MANTQINIIANGTKTLATAGKYCDRNIDVNVNVPASGIIPSGSKSITSNGTYDVTQYAEVEVNVSQAKPTQFVNVLEYADSLEINKKFSSNGSYNTSQPNGFIAVTLNLNNLPGGNPLKVNNNEIRFRGCNHIDNVFAQSVDGVTYEAKGIGGAISSVDEYHDNVWTRGYIGGPYVRFNIARVAYSTSSNVALSEDFDPIAEGCIVTFNQPIGNAGYVGGN